MARAFIRNNAIMPPYAVVFKNLLTYVCMYMYVFAIFAAFSGRSPFLTRTYGHAQTKHSWGQMFKRELSWLGHVLRRLESTWQSTERPTRSNKEKKLEHKNIEGPKIWSQIRIIILKYLLKVPQGL